MNGPAHHHPNLPSYARDYCYLSLNFNMLTLTGQVSRHRHPNMKGYRKLTFLKVIGIVLPFPGCSVAW